MQHFVLFVAFTGGLILSAYPRYAPKRGWRVWRSLKQHGGATASAGFASMAGAAIFIVSRADWWMAAGLIAAGILGGFVLMRLLKSTVQGLALALVVFGWLWFVLMELRW